MSRLIVIVLALVVALIAGAWAFDHYLPERSVRLGVDLERSRSGLVEKRIVIDGFDMVYLEGGQGAPLILIHGFGADKDNFTRVARRLTPHYRVLIPDLPGFGASSKPVDASYSVPAQAARVRAFAQALGFDRVHLGGSSMGGWISVEYAIAHPDEVGSLWLLGSAGTAAGFESELTARIDADGRNPLLARTPEEYPAIVDFVMSKKPYFPPSFYRVLGARAAQDYPLHARIFEHLDDEEAPSPGLDGRMLGLETPALVVFGADERVINPAAAETFSEEMPNARVIIMDGIGHLPMLEDPAAAAADYLRFRLSLL